MYRMIAAMLTCALLTTLTVVDAQDNHSDNKAKTQGDIMREREQACEGLKDAALQECMQNYVGPERDRMTGEVERKPPADRRAQDPAGGVEDDGSPHVDTTSSNKHPSTTEPGRSRVDGEKQ